MKFCYLDESGTGSEPFAIMVGVIVDSQRMHKTKKDWEDLLYTISQLANKPIKEFHTKDFYKGNGPWREVSGETRKFIITAILRWIQERKHSITFSSIDKNLFKTEATSNHCIIEISMWCFIALHQILAIQKYFQSEKKNKGNTVLIFDREVTEEAKLTKLVLNPPVWTDTYYQKGIKQDRLDQIIDVPYYGDSEDVGLIQIADLIAYILRKYIEIKEGKSKEDYNGELLKLEEWIKTISYISLPTNTRYPKRGRDNCSELFYKLAPSSIRTI